MSKRSWYAVRAEPPEWAVLKFEDGLFEKTYHVGEAGNRLHCDCFAGNKDTCRHRKMVEHFRAKPWPSGTLYNFDMDQWQEPEEVE